MSASTTSFHRLGVACGLAAGVWLGAAEAPTKLVNAGLSPFATSLCMVAGVFVARWTFPTLLKGTRAISTDLMERKHLVVWALLAGFLWVVANTLTVFAIRDVGLSTAFPIWNANSLIGIFWGWLLFGELKGGGPNVRRILTGAIIIVTAAILLGFSTLHNTSIPAAHATRGLIAAAGASLMWGTMYIPYRKAYLSGLNPLSFVTAFTIGELGLMTLLTLLFDGGIRGTLHELAPHSNLLFWLFLGGFVWVVGDIFQQYATKYIGISRGIPLSNTNQLWGLAWGGLVFGELSTADPIHRVYVILGSLLMLLGAYLISSASSSDAEEAANSAAIQRECERYGISANVDRADEQNAPHGVRHWWDNLILLVSTGVFILFGLHAVVPPVAMNYDWMAVLAAMMAISISWAGWILWKRTRFN